MKTPPFDLFISHYKIAAKMMAQTDKIKLTEAQHILARKKGHSDWNNFQYWVKERSDLEIGLDKKEVLFIMDVLNGYMPLEGSDQRVDLLAQAVDGDRYDGLGYKWFGQMSRWDEEKEEYLPSQPMAQFIEKLDGLSLKQIEALFMTGAAFWEVSGGFGTEELIEYLWNTPERNLLEELNEKAREVKLEFFDEAPNMKTEEIIEALQRI